MGEVQLDENPSRSSPEIVDEAEGHTLDLMKEVVENHMGQLRFCYQSALSVYPDMEGEAELLVVIEDERAIEVEVVDWTSGDDAFTDCIASKVIRWQFTGMPDGEIMWPVVFQQ